MVIAAFLDDVVEDTHKTIQEMEWLFGGKVRHLIEYLTDVEKWG